MKYLFLSSLLIGTTCALSAESQFERELKQISEQRNAAIVTAFEPINRRYQASLEQLLKRATQANDLDAAIKIRDALFRAPATTATNQTKANLIALLTNGRWEWFSSAEFTGNAFHISFAADNRCSIEPGIQFLTKWEAVNAKQVRIYRTDGNYYVFDIDASAQQGINNIRESTQKEARSIRLKRQ